MKQPIIKFTDEQLITLHNLMMETGAGTITYSWLDETHHKHQCKMTLGRVEALLKDRGYTKEIRMNPTPGEKIIITWKIKL